MQITPQRIRVLCKMAYDGARDDAGREFAMLMLEGYEQLWQSLTNEAQAQMQVQAEAKMASKLEAAKAEARRQVAPDAVQSAPPV